MHNFQDGDRKVEALLRLAPGGDMSEAQLGKVEESLQAERSFLSCLVVK